MRPNVLRAHRSHESSVIRLSRASARESHLFDYRLILALLMLAAAPAFGQTLIQFDVTSTFNADLVVNDSTTNGADLFNDPIDDPATSNRTFVTQTAATTLGCSTPSGLPDDGFFAANADHPAVQLAYNNNSDDINARRSLPLSFDTYNFTVPALNYASVHLFASAGNGTANVSVILTYATGPDGSANITVPDWFHDAPAGTYTLFNGGDRAVVNATGCQDSNTVAIFGFNIDADETRVLQSVTIDRTNFNSTLGFFGATGVMAVPPNADLAVTKSDSPDPVTAGANLSYIITLTNGGPNEAADVQLSDSAPAETTGVGISQLFGPAFNLTLSASVFTATASTFAPGATAIFQAIVRVDPSQPAASSISNTASVSSATADLTSANNSDTESTDVITSADLAVTKTGSVDEISPGAVLTYILTLTNAGPSDAQSASLTDQVPANTTFVSLTQTAGPAFVLTSPAPGAGGPISVSRPSFAAGDAAIFRLVVRVNGDASADITNTATASATSSDPNTANDSATETTTNTGAPRRGDVNGDGFITVLDVFYLINHLYNSGPPPVGSGDTNSDTFVNAADITFLLNYLFGNGPAPA